jgi:hypothetical protein
MQPGRKPRVTRTERGTSLEGAIDINSEHCTRWKGELAPDACAPIRYFLYKVIGVKSAGLADSRNEEAPTEAGQ